MNNKKEYYHVQKVTKWNEKIDFEIICPQKRTLKVSFFNLSVLQMTKREK